MTIPDIFADMDRTFSSFFDKHFPKPPQEEPMTENEYNQINAIRRSDLLKIRKSPMHYWWAKNNPDEANETTPSLVFGSAAHKYILEPRTFFDEYAIAPNIDRRTKAGKEEWAEFSEQNAGKIVLSTDDMDRLRLMSEAICEHPHAKELLTGTVETPIFWTDEETGVELKIRPDVVSMKDGRPLIVDYKTVTSCGDRAFWSECDKFGYQLQAGMYTEGFTMTHFTEASFAFVTQEKTAPYAVRIWYCDPEFIEQGNREFHELLRYYKQCSDLGWWPGYWDGYLMPYPYKEVAEE